jgi:hypothetical protein
MSRRSPPSSRPSPGTRIAAAEVAGRRAFLDPGVEELANDAFREAIGAEDPRSTF